MKPFVKLQRTVKLIGSTPQIAISAQGWGTLWMQSSCLCALIGLVFPIKAQAVPVSTASAYSPDKASLFHVVAHSQGVLTSTCVLTDLDGDNVPDAVVANGSLHREQGFVYRIDIQLGQTDRQSFFEVGAANVAGLNISTRDIDGDRDIDIVITAGIFRQPVGVWINDGNGNFKQANSALFSNDIWQDPPNLISNQVFDHLIAVISGQYRLHFGHVPTLVVSSQLNHPSIRLASSEVRSCSFPFVARSLRSPPADSPLGDFPSGEQD
jgi:hypothetical protein